MKHEKFIEITAAYINALLKGESKKELKLKYYKQFKQFDAAQLEQLMFNDFLVEKHPDTLLKALNLNHTDSKTCRQLIKLMETAWFARARFHEFCKRNDDTDLKKTIDVCLN